MHVVVNWLWQGVVLTLLAAAAMRTTARASASTRYVLWWIAMILVLLLPALSWLVALGGTPVIPADAAPAIAPVPLPSVAAWPLVAGLGCWALWTLVGTLRLVASAMTLARLRRDALPFPAAREARLTYWQSVRGSGTRRARLVMSDGVRSASVLGLGPALIAVAPGTAARLTDQELDQVLLHEWAHVQRRDDYARLVQIAVRAVAGMHPAVWWIGRRLEIEREIACDDYAVNITGGARILAQCLTKLADVPTGPVSAALAPGVLLASQLTLRVRRLLDPRRNTSTQRSRGLLGSAAAVLTMVAIVLSHVELVVAASPITGPTVQVQTFPITSWSPLSWSPSRGPSDAPIAGDRRRSTPAGAPLSTAEPQTPEAGRPSQSRQDASGVASSSAPSLQARDPGADVGPIEPLGGVVWQLPELPSLSSERPPSAGAATVSAPVDGDTGPTPWGAAAGAGISIGHGSQKAASATADAGTSVGRGSQKAAVATAGFFTKLSRKIAGSF